MKKLFSLLILTILVALLAGCGSQDTPQIAATTLPVYEFTSVICEGTDLKVGQLVTESVSCLHDYTLQVTQMRMIESADTVVISGAGLEAFLADALDGAVQVIDASSGTHIHAPDEGHDHTHEEDHHHDLDPHIWLSPENARIMADNICQGLCALYPEHADRFRENLALLNARLEDLQSYGQSRLQDLACRELITFHDGFAYFAESYDLTILRAVEEESGSEASAAELIELIGLVNDHRLPAVFTEVNGSVSAADVICAETGAEVYTLDMAMSGDSYFDAMYHNIDVIKEALG